MLSPTHRHDGFLDFAYFSPEICDCVRIRLYSNRVLLLDANSDHVESRLVRVLSSCAKLQQCEVRRSLDMLSLETKRISCPFVAVLRCLWSHGLYIVIAEKGLKFYV